jgi:hypothetical protein
VKGMTSPALADFLAPLSYWRSWASSGALASSSARDRVSRRAGLCMVALSTSSSKLRRDLLRT